MSERALTAAIIRYMERLKAAGEPIWWFKVAGGPMQKAGIPDLCVVHKGQSIWLEVKADRGKTSTLQLHRMKEIEAAGGRTAIVRSVADVMKELS